MDYLYDETFDGFLNCVYHHYYMEKATGIFSEKAYQHNILEKCITVATDLELANKVYKAICLKSSKYDMERIYRVFHTNTNDKEIKLLNYIRLAFKYGSKIRLLHGNQIVLDVQAAEQRLGLEVHRLCGLVRFSVICSGNTEILFSTIEPDNDVLQFIAPHFSDRFHKSPFVIHDLKRNKSLISLNKEWYITDDFDVNKIKYSQSEEEYRNLWKQYFDIMAIRERINPKCQKNFMPIRYWKHLTEIQASSFSSNNDLEQMD